MSKNYSKKNRLKYVMVAAACAATFSLTGLASACKPEKTPTDSDKTTTSKEDTQLLKNGNFEFFTIPEKKDDGNEPEYLIVSPSSWTHGGSTSYTMSGIIGTSDKAWENITADDLADRLDANNSLDSSASDYKDNYIDFNGMKSSDLLYKNSYAASKLDTITSVDEDGVIKYYIDEDDDKFQIYKDSDGNYFYDEAFKRPINDDLISNPGVHNIYKDSSGNPYILEDDGSHTQILVDEKGDYYLEYDEAKDEYSQSAGHVLMLHNYSNSSHNGIAQNYSSLTLSLPSNTAAEISVWVKTSNLLYSGGQFATENQGYGANITVTQTAGNTTLGDFQITSINTEKLLGDSTENNGWIKYTVYVNACNFASTDISIKLGLGEADLPVEGYAFFDDVTVTKYRELDAEGCTYPANAAKINADNAKCDLLSDASDKIFVADTYERLVGDKLQKNDRFSKDFHYLIDLASVSGYEALSLSGTKAGLTVDSNNYVSSQWDVNRSNLAEIENEKTPKLPEGLKNLTANGEKKGLDTRKDLLALINANSSVSGSVIGSSNAEKLTEQLKTAGDLPQAASNTPVLVLYSASGAAYTASFDLTVNEEEYQIISFWVKTSDMDGYTAATVKITEQGNKSNTTNISLDTSDIVTNIGDSDEEKDIYNGWVQCFFFIHNDIEKGDNTKPATVNVEFTFGPTALTGASVTSFKAGWAALANMQSLKVDEDVYSFAGSGSHTASLVLTESSKKTPTAFDEVAGQFAQQVESTVVNPANHNGVNGGSSNVIYVDRDNISDTFDALNTNDHAGLINKEYFLNENGDYEGYTGNDWYNKLISAFGNSSVSALDNWNNIFGTNSVQPLIIVNKLRNYEKLAKATEDNYTLYYVEVKDGDGYEGATVTTENGRTFRRVNENDKFDENTEYYSIKDVVNYGFVGAEKSIAASGVTTVSVKVKVSAGAVAYIYLVDSSENENVLDFTAPSYTFWYDVDGNVLKQEIPEDDDGFDKKANILYTLRDDGLYEDEDGKLYANTWNYTKVYEANIPYYDKNGDSLYLDQLVKGETYYKDAAATVEADHFLIIGDNEKDKLYEYKDGKYYYIVSGETQKTEVTPFDTKYARYNYAGVSEQYFEVVEDTHGEWVTINFVIHAGSSSKTYRLELWSGERASTKTDGNEVGGVVLFDYSYTNITSDDLRQEYEANIIKAYLNIIKDKNLLGDGDKLDTTNKNIDYYRNYVEERLSEAEFNAAIKAYGLDNYKAHYYTYSLYDSADFRPFNKEIAEDDATGYDYSIDDFKESLAYLRVVDGEERYVFADYSTINQDIVLDYGTSDDDKTDDEEKKDDDTNIWLLASSIIIVIALIFAMLAILVRDTMKKLRRRKVLSKNTYNKNKANRYFRKLGIKKEEIEEVEAKSEVSEQPAKAAEPEKVEQPAEETVESEVSEQPAEEATESEVSEQPAEETAAPAESEQTDEGKSE